MHSQFYQYLTLKMATTALQKMTNVVGFFTHDGTGQSLIFHVTCPLAEIGIYQLQSEIIRIVYLHIHCIPQDELAILTTCLSSASV